MSKWKCEICGSGFDNFQALKFDNKKYCPLCYFKQLSADLQVYNEKLEKQLLSKTLPKDSEDMWITYNLEVNKILQENEKLKEQLANNGIVSTCEKCEWFGVCPHSYREFDYKNECEKLKKQQQEFIKYLED